MADPSVVIVRNLPAEPETRQVYARMGFKPHKADIPEAMKPLVIEAMALGRDLVKPIACFCNHRIIMPSGTETRRHDERLEIESAFAIDSRKVITWMNGCSEIYLAAVTLGPELDAKVAELSQSGDMTRAFLLNAYGGEAAEALMESLDREIARQVQARGMTTTKRYSPGYGDWPVTAQRDLLGHLGAERIGIRLTESCLMIPEKSVSAIIGVKPGQIMTWDSKG
ncbi:MAG TPA: vitamin B12 dependent-methionine synthase activation domain-containing protein [bacterium]